MYVIPKDSYEMIADALLTKAEDTYLICQALKGGRGEVIEVWADKEDSPDAVLVKSKGDPRFFEGGIQIFVTAQTFSFPKRKSSIIKKRRGINSLRSNAAAEKLLEHLDKKPATFVFQGKNLHTIISNWYNVGEDTGHYYYRIRRGELQKRMVWPTVRLGSEHESIVFRSQDLGDLFTAYKRSSDRRLSATFAVIQMSEVLSYCFIREGIVGDMFASLN
jgi:hypothetical protein